VAVSSGALFLSPSTAGFGLAKSDFSELSVFFVVVLGDLIGFITLSKSSGITISASVFAGISFVFD